MESRSERRKRKLHELCKAVTGGTAAVADKAKLNPQSLYQVLSGALLPRKKDGSRSPKSLGDRATERLEDEWQLGKGWFDNDAPLPRHLGGSGHEEREGRFLSEDSAQTYDIGLYGPGLHDAPWITRIPLLAGEAGPHARTHSRHGSFAVDHLGLSTRWIQEQLPGTDLHALRFMHAHDQSMSPTFGDGDVLLVDISAHDPRAGEGVFVLQAGDRRCIRRMRTRMDGMLEASCDDVRIKTVDLLDGSQDMQVLGRIVWAWNGRKP